MVLYFKKIIKKILSIFNYSINKKTDLNRIKNLENFNNNYGLLKYIDEPEKQFAYLKNIPFSKSQLKQDLFVLNELNFIRNGYFVEFGVKDGIDLSNTYLLEKMFNWNGILSEPATVFHKDLFINREVNISKNCVWNRSNEKLIFNEVMDASELSTIDSFANKDMHFKNRRNYKQYKVNTITLEDLLKKYNAPKIIDYLSIDTEGSEYEIIKDFNFKNYQFRVITIEHNYTKQRKDIEKLLSDNGYKRKFEELSLFDDWYVLEVIN